MKNVVLAEAIEDLAALLDYAGKHDEASSLRGQIPALSSGRVRGLEALTQLNRIRAGIVALRHTRLSERARGATEDVAERIQRVLSQN